MGTIIRQSYIDKIERYLGKETIIVLVGQRRVGKSYTLKMIRDRKRVNEGNNHSYNTRLRPQCRRNLHSSPFRHSPVS